ncbi:MAG: rhomboid family intramembrane serine protease, partial [Acidobacteriota bacterium]|nr:rhomboid family intramembrane serine protease [Acidobacteriota bacterium]
IFLMMLASPGALGDPATLVAWGANYGPRTTGGELWRVFTSTFVHRGVLHLLVNVAALVQLGLLLERVVGPFTFGTIFFAAGVLGSIIIAAAAPMSVVNGSAAAVFGLYGLLCAAALRGVLQDTAVRIPLAMLKRLAPVAALFALYCVVTGEPSIAAKVGLSTGVVGGIMLTRSVPGYGARHRRFAGLGAATAAIVLMSAMSLRAVTNVRPEIAVVVANEERTAAAYDAAVLRFRKGLMTTRELAQVIDQTIVPDVQRAAQRVSALADVPAEDATLVADAQEYVRLRQESWRVRAEGLRKGNMPILREADKAEQASLQAFERLRSAVSR